MDDLTQLPDELVNDGGTIWCIQRWVDVNGAVVQENCSRYTPNEELPIIEQLD